jgi:hypothetical protein
MEASMLEKLPTGTDLFEYCQGSFGDMTKCVFETIKCLTSLAEMMGLCKGASIIMELGKNAKKMIADAAQAVTGSAGIKDLANEANDVVAEIKENLPQPPSLGDALGAIGDAGAMLSDPSSMLSAF